MSAEHTTERKEKFQRTYRLRIIRHGQKDEEGNLSSKGQNETQRFAQELINNDNFLIYSSDIQRSKDTASILRTVSNSEQISITKLLSEEPYTDERISELSLDGGLWLLMDEPTEQLPSMSAFAGKMAKFIEDMENNLSKETKAIDIIAVSHVPPIMAFVGMVIADSQGEQEINEDIKNRLHSLFDGGFPSPLEGFEINKHNNKRILQVKDKSFEVTDELLESLILKNSVEPYVD